MRTEPKPSRTGPRPKTRKFLDRSVRWSGGPWIPVPGSYSKSLYGYGKGSGKDIETSLAEVRAEKEAAKKGLFSSSEFHPIFTLFFNLYQG